MKLIENWKDVATRAHSMWALYLSVILLVMPDAIYVLLQIDTNPRVWFFAGLAALIYGIWGRLIDQGIRKVRDELKGDDGTKVQSHWAVGLMAILVIGFALSTGNFRERAATPSAAPAAVHVDDAAMPASDTAFTAVAVPFIGKWEGLRLEAYRDIVGVWTVCYGETKGVRPGQAYTKAECDAMLEREALSYRAGLHKYLTPATRTTRLPVRRDVAFTSLAYNVGVGGAGKSTAVRRLNAGDVAGACDALTWWNKAGGRVVRGLVRRRGEEHGFCMAGVS